MAKRNTRQAIVELFIQRVEESSLSKVHVADLISDLGLNRNTFYYHFPSKQDLALGIFLEDLDVRLRESFKPRWLEFTALAGKGQKDREYAFYAHVETGAHMLDSSEFTRCLLSVLGTRRSFYRRLFDKRELDFLISVRNLYQPQLAADIEFILGGRYMPSQTKNLLAVQSMNALAATIDCHLGEPDDALLDDAVNPFLNLMNESLSQAILTHPINRRPRR